MLQLLLSCSDFLDDDDDKGEEYQNCSVLHYVLQLYMIMSSS